MKQRSIEVVPRDTFTRRFASDVATMPENLCLVGYSEDADVWFVAPEAVRENAAFLHRVPSTLRFLTYDVLPRLPGGSFWFVLCFYDGWRERIPYADAYAWVPPGDLDGCGEWQGAAGELPLLSDERRWLACYGAHRGDPSAVLLPEAHYHAGEAYAAMFAEVAAQGQPWEARQLRAVFCAGDHGSVANYFPPVVEGRPHPRRHLAEIAAAGALPIDVHLGHGVPRAQQMGYRWILDVDGFVRTWDAFAWKIRSGSVLLSPASPWESFFTRLFEPWTHFVPVANDFADLAERLEWCRANDYECRQIAQRARQRAEEVYRPEYVSRVVARQWRRLLEASGPGVATSVPLR